MTAVSFIPIFFMSTIMAVCDAFVLPVSSSTRQSSRIHYTSIRSLSPFNIDIESSSDLTMLSTSSLSPLSQLHSSSLLIDTALIQFDGSSTSIATALGYIVGIASLLLYTPIAVRILRTKSASGLAVTTWYCKGALVHMH